MRYHRKRDRGPEAVRGTRKDVPTEPHAGTKVTQEVWKSRRTDIALSIDERGHPHQQQTNQIENQAFEHHPHPHKHRQGKDI